MIYILKRASVAVHSNKSALCPVLIYINLDQLAMYLKLLIVIQQKRKS